MKQSHRRRDRTSTTLAPDRPLYPGDPDYLPALVEAMEAFQAWDWRVNPPGRP